jgi:hypothetical protein
MEPDRGSETWLKYAAMAFVIYGAAMACSFGDATLGLLVCGKPL